MIKHRVEYRLDQTATVLIVVLMALLAVSTFAVGSTFAEQTRTIANTTLTKTQNVTATVTFSSVSIQYATVTVSTYVTVTFIGNSTVVLSGTARSGGIGTTATNIIFINSQDNQSSVAQITAGNYRFALGNHAYYIVKIQYTTAVGGVGSGTCVAGGVVLYAVVPEITANWAC